MHLFATEHFVASSTRVVVAWALLILSPRLRHSKGSQSRRGGWELDGRVVQYNRQQLVNIHVRPGKSLWENVEKGNQGLWKHLCFIVLRLLVRVGNGSCFTLDNAFCLACLGSVQKPLLQT
jgi:hypothetical protein